MRETFESALVFSERTLRGLGEADEVATEVVEEVRRRDADRLAAPMTGDIASGREFLLSNLPEEERERARATAPPIGART